MKYKPFVCVVFEANICLAFAQTRLRRISYTPVKAPLLHFAF